MKTGIWVSLLAFVAAALTIGCGGSGGSGGGSGGGGGSTGSAPLPGQYLEFVGNNRGSNLDPLNLQVGDDIQVVVANYDPAGNRTVLSARNWQCSVPATFVSLTSTGRLKVVSRPAGVFSVSAIARVSGIDKTVQQDSAVPPLTGTTISGKVVKELTTTGIKYVQVTFYDASGAAIAGSRTGDGGTYRANVPAGVASASIKGSTVPAPPYYRTFQYQSKIYTMDASTCPLKLTNLVQGQNNALANMIVFLQENGPPPPPDGCKP